MSVVALGPCWLCGETFEFDPELVPTVGIDPATNLPTDLSPAPVGRPRWEPLCEQCVKAINPARRRQGQAEIEIPPGAYP